MKKKQLAILTMAALLAAVPASVPVLGAETEKTKTESAETNILEDGVYSAAFDTDSGMFHVNESLDGRGTLTVKDGKMTIHVSLASKGILNLFPGKAEDAKKEGAELLEPTTDKVTYSDGYEEEVYGFDIPVPALDEEFDVALIGKKGKWYDHKVSVSDPKKEEEKTSEEAGKTAEDLGLEDGNYTVSVALEGGSGRATVEETAELEIKDGISTATIVWSSPNYDYMKIGTVQYPAAVTDGHAVCSIPVTVFDRAMPVKANTTAMSEPHEIDYTLRFDSASITPADT